MRAHLISWWVLGLLGCGKPAPASMVNDAGAPAQAIIIDSAVSLGPAQPLIGFVHGIAAPSGPDADFPAATSARITGLAPSLWKVSDERHQLKALFFNAAVMYAVSDEYLKYAPVYFPWNSPPTSAGSFDDWAAFNANTRSVVEGSIARGRPVDYWGVLNEPQFTRYSANDQQRLVETLRQGLLSIRAVRSDQQVAAPTTIGFNEQIFEAVMNDAVSHSVSFDAFDWHELGSRPEEVPAHVASVRAMLAARPSLGSPVLIIDEYASPEEHHLPGFAVAWFFYLEQAKVRYAARACWDVSDAAGETWSNCWNGLDGLFMRDNLTPQALYWVFERYSTMGGNRLASASTAPSEVVALASATSSSAEHVILVGRFVKNISQAPSAPANVTLVVKNLSFSGSTATVRVEKVPYVGPASGSKAQMSALAAPILVDTREVPIVAGEVTIELHSFADRDAYFVSVRPE